MHRHVMWAVCDVSVVQPHLYFGLFVGGMQVIMMVFFCSLYVIINFV